MQTITKTLRLVLLVLLISFCTNVSLNAQTPADDPGIGGPGTSGSSPEGDGAPIVPFDGSMTFIFATIGIGFVSYKMKSLSSTSIV